MNGRIERIDAHPQHWTWKQRHQMDDAFYRPAQVIEPGLLELERARQEVDEQVPVARVGWGGLVVALAAGAAFWWLFFYELGKVVDKWKR